MDPPTERDGARSKRDELALADKLCVAFFVLCLGLWIVCSPFMAEVLAAVVAGRADGLGMGLFAVFLSAASVPFLIVALVLSILASHLSRVFRILCPLPALLGILAGVAIFVTLLLQGK